MFFGLQNDREWAVLCERVLGRLDLVADRRFATNPDWVAHDAELTVIIESARWAALSPDEVMAILDQAGIASARLRTLAEFAAHPRLAAWDRWREVGAPAGPSGAAPTGDRPRPGARHGRRPGPGPAHRRGPGGVPPPTGSRPAAERRA